MSTDSIDALHEYTQLRRRFEKIIGIRSAWDEHPDHPREDWLYEVANGDTVLGYLEWCVVRIVNAGERDAHDRA